MDTEIPETLLKAFCDYLRFERQRSAHTLEAYVRDLRQFNEWLAQDSGLDALHDEAGLQAVTELHLRGWLASMEVSRPTLKRKFSALRSYFRYWQKRGLRGDNPVEAVRVKGQSRSLPDLAPAASLTAGLSAETARPGLDFEAVRDWCVVELLYGCGLRRGEIVGLKRAEIDLEDAQLRVTGKGGKVRVVPFNPPVGAALERYIEAARAEGFSLDASFFVTAKGAPIYPRLVNRLVEKRLSALPEVSRTHPHALRHCFATHLLDAGADLNAIKELLGHSSLKATEIYTRVTTERMKEAYDAAHPRA